MLQLLFQTIYRYERAYTKIFYLLVSIFLVFSVLYYFSIPMAGDEIYFMNDMNRVKNYGWISAIKENMSIPMAILTYPLTFFLPVILSFRMMSCILTILLLIYLYKRFKSLDVIFYIVLPIAFYQKYFAGTNDVLFIASTVIFYTEVFFLIFRKQFNSALCFSALVVAFFTRELLLAFIPSILYVFYILYHNRKFIKWHFRIPGLITIVFLVLNMPSIVNNGHLSYDRKHGELGATWPQRQYFSQLQINDGKLPPNHRAEWKDVADYLELHGENALPKTQFGSLFFDIGLTLKEFPKDFIVVVIKSGRETGLIFILTLLMILIIPFRNKKISLNVSDSNLFVPIISCLVTLSLAFIVISYVETRWLQTVFILSILFFCYAQQHHRNLFIYKVGTFELNFFVMNKIIAILMTLLGMYKLYLMNSSGTHSLFFS